MNSIPLSDDVAFWSRQMTEHALFLSLLLEDARLRTRAANLHSRFIGNPDSVPGLLSELLQLKQEVVNQQATGQWVGWALPSFSKHILFEGLYFQARLRAGTSQSQDAYTWLQIVKDHADVGPKLVDPAASPTLVTSAADLSRQLAELQHMCSLGLRGCLYHADALMMGASAWVRSMPPGLSILPPVLTEHIIRENERGRMVVGLIERG